VTGHLGGCQSRILPILGLWGGKLLTEAHKLGVVGAGATTPARLSAGACGTFLFVLFILLILLGLLSQRC